MDSAPKIQEVFKKRPNFLILMCDQERYPPCYENRVMKEWRSRNLQAQKLLRQNGMDFQRHYTGSTACCPARATLFTGQYPSLHGVSQTNGVAKGPFDPDMFWLDPSTVPTMGDYFRTAGYRTFYKGKWHISNADIIIPGSHESILSYRSKTGVPDQILEKLYLEACRLEDFGFSGWIGPEPHGTNPHNSASSARVGLNGRDTVYAQEVVNLLDELDRENMVREKADPWLLVASFLNPHDIAIYGLLTHHIPLFHFEVDDTIPEIPPPPTYQQPFGARPRCQLSYRRIFSRATQPVIENSFYRRLYYQLQKNVDQAMLQVLEKLRQSSFYDDTIVIFTADHGELLGAHGGMVQKWYCAFEEVIHVPLVIHNPRLFPKPRSVRLLTSHVDILPTMLKLAGIDVNKVQQVLRADHSEVHSLVGRDLSALDLDGSDPVPTSESVFFMTDDDITQGSDQTGFSGQPYDSVIQPNHLETILTYLPSALGPRLWKYSRYFDNPQFWIKAGKKDNLGRQFKEILSKPKHSVNPSGDEYELYNVTADPLEETNLAIPECATRESLVVQQRLDSILHEQSRRKRLAPTGRKKSGLLPDQT